jgi:hypothetical protein
LSRKPGAQSAIKSLRLGKHPPRFDKRTLLLGNYLKKELTAPPPSVDYSKSVTSWPMFGNDRLDDCTIAAAGHMIEEWTALSGVQRTLPESAIEDAYNYFAKGNADAGANMLDVLKHWRKTGIGGDKIHAFAQIEPKNNLQLQNSTYLFGNCYIGLALPNFAVVPGTHFVDTPWTVPASGPVGDAAPNSKNGHCVPAVAYDPQNIWVVTWGKLKPMSWQFYTTYVDEAYAVLSLDWINKKLKTAPQGLNLQALEADLKAVTSA